MLRYYFIFFSICFYQIASGQLSVARDTVTVIENNYVLKMPWANGINNSTISNIDLNFDNIKDLVVFDKVTQFSVGRFRCFINKGTPGQTKYVADPDLSYSFPATTNWAVCLDYNCDGKEDLFCSVNGAIRVYKNVSTPTLGVSFTLVKPIVYSDFNPFVSPSISPLYASTVGVPGFADIDGDGDIDILTFSSGGYYVEYHKNMSKEKYGNCDSLVYQLEDGCWGKLTEQSCIVSMNQCPSKPLPNNEIPLTEKKRHAGSCLMCFDSNGDNLKDLIMGDISCQTVQFALNTGSITNAVISDTTKLYPNFPSKNSTQQIKMNAFPCAYSVDCDGDGKKDLVATPNAFGSENVTSVWYYKNTSTTNTVNFQFVKDNFLQDEMIEVGQNSFPVVFDYDNDGRKDLLVGNYGYFSPGSLKAKLALYKNIGTASQPSYSLITRDYAGVASYNLSNAMPTVGDIDTDGDDDICIGTSSGQIHWLENTAGIGNVCNFSVFHANSFSFTTNSAAAAPQLFDIDNDGKLDLMIGTKNGRTAYYKNVGTATAASFSLITNFFGNIDVKGNVNLYGIDGYAVPYFYKVNSATKLLLGNINGQIFYYDVPAIITNSCTLINATTNNLNEGGQASVCFEDVNNDGKRDLFVGNASGGLSFFSSKSNFVGIEDLTPQLITNKVKLYPNPADSYLNIDMSALNFESANLKLYTLLGQEVAVYDITANSQSFSIKSIERGIYLAKIDLINNLKTVSVVKKIIIN